MPQRDTVDKIVTYFAAVTLQPFTYKGTRYEPRPLRVSFGVLQGFKCPEGCGGCCPRFSLDWLPFEKRPTAPRPRMRYVEFDGRKVLLFSDMQGEWDNYHCFHLNMQTGRCTIHDVNPFSCDFELLRFSHFTQSDRPNQLTTRLFGRGHAMLRVDDKRGALCSITPVDPKTVADTVRKLERLERWAQHFGLKKTHIPTIVEWAGAYRKNVNQLPLVME